MKIDLSKLIYNQVDEITISQEIDIPKNYLENSDIKDISKVKVNGYITYNGENYELILNIKCKLLLVCSVSLKDVNYDINIDIDDILDENSEDFYKIVNNSLDLVPIIWQNILMEVPIRVVSPDIKEENIYGDGWKFITTEEEDNKEIDPRLSKFKDLLREE